MTASKSKLSEESDPSRNQVRINKQKGTPSG